jgi:peptide-methionine (R)-S-oxide reductase
MIRMGFLAITLGVATLIYQGTDESAKTAAGKSTDKTSEKSSEKTGEKKADEVKLSHEQQIEEMFKKHPFIANPKGELRKSKDFNKLKGLEASVINKKDTERAFTGEYWNHKGQGTYICRKCNCPLYRSGDKFDSHCGWPSFDDEIPGTVTRVPDKDGLRVEIVCTNCGGHLGHVFLNEQFTLKNTRHCVNSKSILFVDEDEPLPMMILPDEAKKRDAKEKEKADSLKKAGSEDKKDDKKDDAKTGSSK